MIASFPDERQRAIALTQLAQTLAQAGDVGQARRIWTEAERVIASFPDERQRAEHLTQLATDFATQGENERLLHLVHRWWQGVKRREEAIGLLSLAYGFLPRYPKLGIAFSDAFVWVDTFLRG